MILNTLKTAVGFCRLNLGFNAKDVSARSLRATGVMAFLCSRLDSNIINLVGICHRNEMIRYLHVQVEPLMRNFSRLMLTHGDYPLLPHQEEVP